MKRDAELYAGGGWAAEESSRSAGLLGITREARSQGAAKALLEAITTRIEETRTRLLTRHSRHSTGQINSPYTVMETLESSRVCRLCGKQSGISINIFDKNENHVKKINAILPIMVRVISLFSLLHSYRFVRNFTCTV